MNIKRLIATLLLIAGGLSLAYGGFDYIQETHEVSLGPIQLSVDESKHVSVPVWAGVCALVLGAVLLLPGKKD